MADRIRVGVFGAGGRMGAEVCRAVVADPDLELVAGVDPGHAGRPLAELTGVETGLVCEASAAALAGAGAQVAVDFTVAEAARANLAWCAANGVHAVVGTSGLGPADIEELGRLFADGAGGGDAGPNCVVAANFAIGAVLMMRFAAMAAPYFETAEVIELHHDGKIDAPSGTSLETVRLMAEARSSAGSGDFGPDPTRSLVVEGARGASGQAGIHVHSLRLRGMVAHQEVLLGTTGQTLLLRHDSYDRTSFMPGVVLAVKKVGTTPGLTVGLDPLL
ncbi:MAG TPA: 4-hydroxy-tetrahydrodipicolinate reductase [Acidimicrobiales bacterium]|nr:4-hydroxy-tetrahydrodipicolinate reductase [Acidimicrobiales bacterium]